MRRFAEIPIREIRWLWEPRLARGKLVQIVGYPGEGKTTLAIDIVARVSTGSGWPDGAPSAEATDVIIVAAEDDPEDTLRPKLEHAGADMTRVHSLDGWRQGDGPAEQVDLSNRLDLAAIIEKAKEVKAGLIYIDAPDDVLGDQYDGHGGVKTRRALAPLRQLACATGACVLLARHTTKRIAPGGALAMGNGSIQYEAVSRGVMLVVLDPDDTETEHWKRRRLLLSTKSNIGVLGATLPFNLVKNDPTNQKEPPHLAWGKTDTRTADEVVEALRAKQDRKPDPHQVTKEQEAEQLLRDELATYWAPVSHIEHLAGQYGISERTLDRARASLGTVTSREGFGKGSVVFLGLSNRPYSATPARMALYDKAVAEREAQASQGQPVVEVRHRVPTHRVPPQKSETWRSMDLDPDPDEVARAGMAEGL